MREVGRVIGHFLAVLVRVAEGMVALEVAVQELEVADTGAIAEGLQVAVRSRTLLDDRLLSLLRSGKICKSSYY